MRKKILLIQSKPGMGDTIWHMPMMKAITAHCGLEHDYTLLMKIRTFAGIVFKYEPTLKNVIYLDQTPAGDRGIKRLTRMLGTVQQIKAMAFDEAWVLQPGATFGVIPYLAGIPNIYGYRRGIQRFTTNRGTVISDDIINMHPIDRAHAFLKANNIPEIPLSWQLTYSNQLPSPFDLPSNNLPGDSSHVFPRPWIVTGIGAHDPLRCWPQTHHQQLCDLLTAADFQGTLFFMGTGLGEEKLAHNLIAAVKNPSFHLCPWINQPLEESIKLIHTCDVFYGNDSGLMNVAGALQKPTIGLFGCSRIPDVYPTLTSIFPTSSPPNMHEKINHDMNDISPQNVFAALSKIINI